MPTLKKTKGGVSTGRSEFGANAESGPGRGTPQNKWGPSNLSEKPSYNSSSSSLEKNARLRGPNSNNSFLHSSYEAQSNEQRENIPYQVVRTKSSGSLNQSP